MRKATLLRVLDARLEGRALVVVTGLTSGKQSVLFADGETSGEVLADAVRDAASTALLADASTTFEHAGERWFLQVHSLARRMLIVGAVHIAQALAPMAQLADFAVTVIDPRRAFATDARFPHVEVRAQWPDDALRELKLDANSALVTLTHDPKIDDPALLEGLGSDACYIGSLGSNRTHAKRIARLRDAGVSDSQIARIHAPIGLDIGAKSPGEIAASILAEVVNLMRGGRLST